MKKRMKVVSTILLVLTVLPIFLEARENFKEIFLIVTGLGGSLWAGFKLYEQLKTGKIFCIFPAFRDKIYLRIY